MPALVSSWASMSMSFSFVKWTNRLDSHARGFRDALVEVSDCQNSVCGSRIGSALRSGVPRPLSRLPVSNRCAWDLGQKKPQPFHQWRYALRGRRGTRRFHARLPKQVDESEDDDRRPCGELVNPEEHLSHDAARPLSAPLSLLVFCPLSPRR